MWSLVTRADTWQLVTLSLLDEDVFFSVGRFLFCDYYIFLWPLIIRAALWKLCFSVHFNIQCQSQHFLMGLECPIWYESKRPFPSPVVQSPPLLSVSVWVSDSWLDCLNTVVWLDGRSKNRCQTFYIILSSFLQLYYKSQWSWNKIQHTASILYVLYIVLNRLLLLQKIL